MEKPKHPRTRFFVESKFFDGLTSFSALEDRISALPTPEQRGDAFEVFGEAYFATQRIAQAKTVWPFDSIPLPIKERLSLGQGRDLGVDGIFETHQGEFHAYQVKFRSGRPSLNWSELSTFMGLTDQVDKRVIFTNCDDLPLVLQERKGFYSFRGSDLEGLEERDFEAIQSWLKATSIERKQKEPLSHQRDALDKILPALMERDRATVLMPCGTGKTLVALWVAEQLVCQKILVLVPSLALLSQTLREWMKETRLKEMSYLCVCSDRTVIKGEDEIVLRQPDVDFPVTTDSATVRKFLETATEAPKVVFSTYQSARVVAEGMTEQEAFDLSIFDEAHKTAGREGVNFAFPLKDTNFPIAKRLFLTATPRHYDVSRTDKEGDAKLVYSMDVPEVYGPVVYRLSFAEAVQRDIICDYKVIISVITSEMVTEELLRRGEVVVEEDIVRARQVANQIALQSAIENSGIQRIITFHNTVKSAASFTGKGPQGISTQVPEFAAYHVNGEMSTVQRERIVASFRGTKQAVISNARCLTEGVDVPAVDMVAFLTPKRSKVDIVQATGRAMRKSEATGKTTGYVLVPLFVQHATGESIEDAVVRAGFDEVWAVLQAMQEQDKVLADIVCQMREDRGRTKGFDDQAFREKVVVLGPGLSLDSLRQSITTQIIDRIGSTWDERFGELKAYKERYGHSNVPRGCPETSSLANWVHNQRRRKDTLSAEKISQLNDLGFLWDPHVATWEEQFAELKRFKDQHGHCNVKSTVPENRSLFSWVSHQRDNRIGNTIRADHFRRLDEIGFVWDMNEYLWNEMFSALTRFKDRYGHCNVRRDFSENPKLAVWVNLQRTLRKREKLSEERVRRLHESGFIWDVHESFWEEMLSELTKFNEKHGHCNVPYKWPENLRLATWAFNQRMRREKLSKECIRCLDEIGYIWDTNEAAWTRQFAELKQFKDQHGHCNVTRGSTGNRGLPLWISRQRRENKKGTLGEERVRRLDSLGFEWERRRNYPKEGVWEEHFAELKQFKDQHGHCNVTRGSSENPELVIWVQNQRQKRREETLSEKRIHRLDSLGFEWERRKKSLK